MKRTSINQRLTGVVGIMLLLISVSSLCVRGQYVQQGNFLNEGQRRLHYALDDWVSYMSARRFVALASGDRYLYVATDGGVWRYHHQEKYWDYPFTTSNGLPGNRILQMTYDDSRNILRVRTKEGAAEFNPVFEKWEESTSLRGRVKDESRQIELTQANSIRNNQFYPRESLKYLPAFSTNHEYRILSDWILSGNNFQEFKINGFLKDNYGKIWFLVNGFGIGAGDWFLQRIDFYRIGISDIAPRAIAHQQRDWWIGGLARDGGQAPGITRYPSKKAGWEYFRSGQISQLARDDVFDIAVDGSIVWFATNWGVALFEADHNQWSNISTRDGLISNQIKDIEIFGKYLYAATDQGINRIHRASRNVERIKEERFQNLKVNQLAVQGDTLWAATRRGAFRYAETFESWEFITAKAVMPDAPMTAVGAFQQEVWFATDRGVLGVDITSDTWQSYPQLGYDAKPPYRDIQVNRAAVWVATKSGLLKFDRARKYWRLFSTRDGLLDNNCFRLLLDGSFIWIVNQKGITRFRWHSRQRID